MTEIYIRFSLDTQISVIDHWHIARALAQLMRAAAWRAGLIARVTQVRPHDLQRPLHSLRLGRQINLCNRRQLICR